MQLTIFNGSPRGKKGNSRFMIDAFIRGFLQQNNNEGDDIIRIIDLINIKNAGMLRRYFEEADHVLIAFPLYVDSMPGIVKKFFEILANCKKGDKKKYLGFFVQSGFPERTQSIYLEKYLKKLSVRLGCRYQGTVIKGGVEIIRIAPLQANPIKRLICAIGILTNLGGVGHLLDSRRLFNNFFKLGKTYKAIGKFDKKILTGLDMPAKLNRFGFLLYKTIGENFYWRYLLDKNRAYDKKNDMPYIGSFKD